MNKKGLMLSILGIIGLIAITAGVTYAFFNYAKEGTTDNAITTGTITFLYTEVSGVGRGISIDDAFPISDTQGKRQTGEGKVFDFKVTSTTQMDAAIPYEVTARKNSESTLDEKAVKLYLTKIVGNNEEEVLLSKYSDLGQTSKVSKDKYIEKTIYTGKVPANQANYEQNFRLRMWIDKDIKFSPNPDGTYPYNDKTFTVTVNVYANAKVVTEEDSITEINSLTVGGVESTAVTGKDYDYEAKLPEGTTSTTINIEPKSDYATVEVERIGDSLTYNNSSNIVRLSSKKTVDVEERYNYFKITVTSLTDEVEEYILRVKVLKTYDDIDAVRNSFKETEKDNVLACEYNNTEETFIDCDYYDILADAFSSKNDGYVVLENDISTTEATVVSEDKNMIFDLNGYMFTSEENIQNIKNYGYLTVNDTKGTGKVIAVGQALNNSGSGTLIVNDGYYERTGGTGTTIYNEETGTIIINDGEFVNSSTGPTILNGLSTSNLARTIFINGGSFNSNGITVQNSYGDTNITGGTFMSSNGNAILNAHGTTNITQTTKPIYISILTANDAQPIRNAGTGTINIKANKANACTSSASSTTSGLCAYNGNSGNHGIAVGAYSTGTINIDGGTYYGVNMGVVTVNTGKINVRNATVTAGKTGAQNNRGGTINICNSIVSGATYDLRNSGSDSGKGTINYDKNTRFKNNTNTPIINNNNGTITANYTGTCQ